MNEEAHSLTQAVLDSAVAERNMEKAVRGKDWDDGVWAHYMSAIIDRRQAVDRFIKATERVEDTLSMDL